MRLLRQWAAPIAFATLIVFWDAMLRPAVSRAQDGSGEEQGELAPVTEGPSSDASGSADGVYNKAALGSLSEQLAQHPTEHAAQGEAPPELADVNKALAALPTGGTEVSPQATALPSGAATTLGMGESFTSQLSTGTASFSIPLSLPSARGGVQPRLDLSYSSAGGFGVAGVGWSIGAAAISRQTDRGLPGYDDRGDWHANQDRFVFGGMELVPICYVSGGSCSGAVAGEVMPAWANRWQYFRARIEAGYLRFFWSPDHQTWRIQGKDGTNLELGVPLDGTGYDGGLERNPDDDREIYRWNLVRQYDNQAGANSTSGPTPVNFITYRYLVDGGATYLSDIYDTSPAAAPTSTDLTQYAHHTALVYEPRPDPAVSYRTGWAIEHALRLARIDVTSKPFAGSTTQNRVMVRRYHLGYDPDAHASLLEFVQLEGQCASPTLERSDQVVPATNCPRLPAMRLEYQHVTGPSSGLLDAQGYAFEPMAETVQQMQSSPPHALDEALTELMDINGDGLPDVVVTAPGLFGGKHAAYLNGLNGQPGPGFGAAQLVEVVPAAGVDAGVLTFNNANVSALDIDGDGVANLVHMPLAKTYSVFRPDRVGTQPWPGKIQWTGRAVPTASHQDVKIDFTQNARDTRVMDVNGDGLVDVVYTSPTQVQTFFSLGRYPGGDDQFGAGSFASANSASIDNAPVTACAPWSAQPARFSDPDTFVGDLNGDGLPDIARVRSGEIIYWPGRGNGFWGKGQRSDCPAESFAVSRHIAMYNAPDFGVADSGTLLLGDVNADGLSDLIEVRNQGVDVYLNDNGVGWTDRHIIDQTPFRPSASNYVRVTDINGSGSPDVLWGAANEYKYIDLTGGVVPHLLTAAHNGLGKTLQLEYRSSASLLLDAAANKQPWQSFGPTVTPVLVRSTVRDNLEKVGRQGGAYVTEYSYRDAVYEGRQREFRGFGSAEVRTLGDANSPTMIQRTTFQLAECPSSEVGTVSDVCSPPERWQDNWREALKGLPVLTELYDEHGIYLSSEHTSYQLKQLYTGRDGRRVTTPLPVTKDAYQYDTAAFDRQESSISLPEVDIELVGLTDVEMRTVPLRATAGTAHVRSHILYDQFGNVTDSIRDGCIEGCPAGVDEAITAHSDFVLPQGDNSGWLWRENHSYVTGSQHPEPRNETLRNYDALGNLKQNRAVLSGTLALDRFHETGATIAPAPPNASGGISTSTETVLVDNTYDTFGHITSWRGSSGRCGQEEADPAYAQLPILAHVLVGMIGSSGCGQTDLVHRVTYDRGFELVTDSTDAAGQPTRFSYDGFGRFASTTAPDPSHPGQLAPAPTLIASYDLPADAMTRPYSVVYVRSQDGPDQSTTSYKEAYGFIDGAGRSMAVLSQADSSAGDAGDWLASKAILYNGKGQPAFTCDPWFYSGQAHSFSIAIPDRSAIPSGCTYAEYDAFGRPIRTYRRSGTQDAELYHRALGVDVWDAADRQAGAHQGTYLSTISDGHGRTAIRTERIHVGAAIEQRHLISRHLPTGEVERVIQRVQGSTDVVRWLRYDSLGRMVLNVEPNTSVGFNPDPTTNPNAIKAWRYAYDDAGDLVGTSDARGCGSNYHYDAAGRLLAEDRSPCLVHQAPYSEPDLGTGNGTESFLRYDTADPDTGTVVDAAGTPFEIDTTLLLGRLVSVSGLGSKSVFRYDSLGRRTGIAVRVQKPGAAGAAIAQRYASRWYVQNQVLDAVGRPTAVTTGATLPELLGQGGASVVSFGYSKRGVLKQIDSSYGRLAGGPTTAQQALTYDATGAPTSATLGDAAATRRDFVYDADLRIQDVLGYRANLALWTNPPPGSSYTVPAPGEDPTQQLLLEDLHYSYDIVGNVTGIDDNRVPGEWPASAKPTNRSFEYDDLYRLTKETYGASSDAWRSPFQAELADASRPQPSPQVSFQNRVAQQTYAYDWLGNISQSTDDQQGFWDRSTGTRVHGSASAGPHQLKTASNRQLAPTSTRKGDFEAGYDASGNVTGVVVRRDGACLPAAASCFQRFDYQYNEVGELVRARRWDLQLSPTNERTTNGAVTLPLPPRTPDADLRYGYDGGGTRMLKTAVDAGGQQKHTVYVFSSLELRGTTWDTASSDYLLTAQTTSLRLFAGPVNARVVYSQLDLPSLTSGHQHLFLEFADSLDSISYLIDQATGELVEYTSYEGYGATDSDYRPGRWAAFREPYQFGGKEQDIEVGLSYFGARYYSPYLGIWISPDPSTIHELGSDTNPYAYVRGSPLMGVDPDGRNPLVAGLISLGVYVGVSLLTRQPVTAQGMVSSFVAGAIGGAVGGGAGSGFAGGMAGGAVGYLASAAINGYGLTTAGLVSSAVGGGVGGAVGAGGADIGQALGAAAASTAVSYFATVALTGRGSARDFTISLASSLAGAVASYGLDGGSSEPAGIAAGVSESTVASRSTIVSDIARWRRAAAQSPAGLPTDATACLPICLLLGGVLFAFITMAHSDAEGDKESDPAFIGVVGGEAAGMAVMPYLGRMWGWAVGKFAGRVAIDAVPAMADACFVAGTLVLTTNGYVAIDAVSSGDEVWAFDPKQSSWGWYPVERSSVHAYGGDMVELYAGGNEIEVTGNHPFCVLDGNGLSERARAPGFSDEESECADGGRWLEARNLESGDLLATDVAPVRVDDIAFMTASASVYNLTVDTAHTYAVSPERILVHNKPWMSAEKWAKDYANQVLKYFKEQGVGTGARSGQHGIPYNRAATVLKQVAKSGRVSVEGGGEIELLPEIREFLSDIAKDFLQKAREINHPMK